MVAPMEVAVAIRTRPPRAVTVVIVVLARSSIRGVPLTTAAGAALALVPHPTIVVHVGVSTARVGVVVPLATAVALSLRPTCEIVVVIAVAARVRTRSPGEPAVTIRPCPSCAIVAIVVALACSTPLVPLTATADPARGSTLAWAIVGMVVVRIAQVGLVAPMATTLATVLRPPMEVAVARVRAITILGIPNQVATTALVVGLSAAISSDLAVASAVRIARVGARMPSARTSARTLRQPRVLVVVVLAGVTTPLAAAALTALV